MADRFRYLEMSLMTVHRVIRILYSTSASILVYLSLSSFHPCAACGYHCMRSDSEQCILTNAVNDTGFCWHFL